MRVFRRNFGRFSVVHEENLAPDSSSNGAVKRLSASFWLSPDPLNVTVAGRLYGDRRAFCHCSTMSHSVGTRVVPFSLGGT